LIFSDVDSSYFHIEIVMLLNFSAGLFFSSFLKFRVFVIDFVL
jgi:hypothetical protein